MFKQSNKAFKEVIDRIIPITLFRRNFGRVSKKVQRLGYAIITVKGRPVYKIESLVRHKKSSLIL